MDPGNISARTLIISVGRIGRPQGDAPSGVYQELGSVMTASFSRSENG